MRRKGTTSRSQGEKPRSMTDIIEDTATIDGLPIHSTTNAVQPKHLRIIKQAVHGEERRMLECFLGGTATNLNELAVHTGTPRSQIVGRLIGAMKKVANWAGTADQESDERISEFVIKLAKNTEFLQPEDVHALVRLEIDRGIPLHDAYWQNDRALSAIMMLAYRRDANGNRIPITASVAKRGFFGYENWYNYLERHHGAVPLRIAYYDNQKYERRFRTKEELLAGIAAQLKTNPANATAWRIEGLRDYYSTAENHDGQFNALPKQLPNSSRAKRFLGHGSWTNLLKNELQLDQRRLKGCKTFNAKWPEVRKVIQREIEAGTPMDDKHWRSAPELQWAYKQVSRRNRNWAVSKDRASDKTYLGHGSWYVFLEKEFGIPRA